MEENFRPENPPPPLWDCGCELTRSNDSDATTSSAAENCEDVLWPSENWTPDDVSEWTDEKHNTYLRCLEMSFVKQLHQSKCMLALCSDQNKRGISQKQVINAWNTSQQSNVLWNGCLHKINNDTRCEPLSSSISVDSRTPCMSKGVCNNSSMGMLGSPPSTDNPEFLKLHSVVKYGKRMISHGLETPSEEFCQSKPSDESLLDCTTEEMGQNFSDEGYQVLSDIECRAKRLKTVSADCSIQDQVAPSKNVQKPIAKRSIVPVSEELAHHNSV